LWRVTEESKGSRGSHCESFSDVELKTGGQGPGLAVGVAASVTRRDVVRVKRELGMITHGEDVVELVGQGMEAVQATGYPLVTEVADPRQVVLSPYHQRTPGPGSPDIGHGASPPVAVDYPGDARRGVVHLG
jgi:hypothetical protein